MNNQSFKEYEIKRREQIANMSKLERVQHFYSIGRIPTDPEDAALLYVSETINKKTYIELLEQIQKQNKERYEELDKKATLLLNIAKKEEIKDGPLPSKEEGPSRYKIPMEKNVGYMIDIINI